MKSFTPALALVAIVSFAFFADNALANSTNWWSYDENELPEFLPNKMMGKSDSEISQAVFKVFQIQFNVIAQHNGHSLPPEMPPIGYFKDEIPLTDVRTTNPQTDIIFTNNNARGFTDNKNHVTIKWVPNQAVTEIEWNELKVGGKYTFSNATYFKQGKYAIDLKGVKYRAATTVSENIQAYPSSVPKSSISYNSAKVSFANGLPDITSPSDSPNVKYFVDEIVRQQVADRVARDAHKNVTLAVWNVAKPYIMFKNYTDPYFPGTNGTLPGPVASQYVVDKFPLSGLDNIRHQVQSVVAAMASKSVKLDLHLTAHDLSGQFDYRLDGGKQSGKASFTIVRMDIDVTFNVLDVPKECETVTTFVRPDMTFDDATFGGSDVGKTLAAVFFDHIKNEVNVSYCKWMGTCIKPQP